MRGKQSPINTGKFFALVIGLFVFWLFLQAALFRLQVLDFARISSYANRQYEKKIMLKARRGSIFERGGEKLATNILYYDLAADPLLVENKDRVARVLSKALHKPRKYFNNKLNQKRHFTYLARRTTQAQAAPVLALKDRGLVKMESFGRYYPFNSLAAQLLGFTGNDNRPLSGMERQFDNLLSGEDGEAMLQYNAARKVSYNADYALLNPIPGNDIYLTIDKDIQTVVERALKKTMDDVDAKSAMVVVMDPMNGAILAMANYPGFDANRAGAYAAWKRRNRVISDRFEPGSTMKMFTSAAILQERLHKPSDITFCKNGRIKIYNHFINDSKKHGWLSFRKVIEKSSNIGMINLTENLGSSVLFRYLKNFGFGAPTGVGLDGEDGGSLAQPGKWSGLSKASIAIGQEIGVTALQITNAYCALVNGGHLYRPYIIDAVRSPEGEWIRRTEKEEIRQVISKEVSAVLKDFMNGVVTQGTGKQAALKEIKAGGKTGTAQKFDPRRGTYSPGKYVASFIGFAPLDKPRYVCAVFFDEPRKRHYGGDVAAPVFAEIMGKILRFGPGNSTVEPHQQLTARGYLSPGKSLPRLDGFDLETALTFLEEKNWDVDVKGSGPFVHKVRIKGNTAVLQAGNEFKTGKKIPNLKGLTLRRALATIDFSLLKVNVEGSGQVVRQSLRPGTPLKKQTKLTITLRN